MMLCLAPNKRRRQGAGFTLIETLVSLVVFGMVVSGVLYGYVQANATAEWSAVSLAAQSCCMMGAEQARAAKWDPYAYPQNTNTDQMPSGTIRTNCGPTYIFDVPIKGNPSATDFSMFVTNVVTISNLMSNPELRQITSQVVWTFYLTGRTYTNTEILLRAADQ